MVTYVVAHKTYSQTCADTKIGHSSQGLCSDAHRIDSGTGLRSAVPGDPRGTEYGQL